MSPRPQHRAGFLLALAAGLFVAALVCVARWAFFTARYSDGAWQEMLLGAIECLACTAALLALLFVQAARSRSRRWRLLAAGIVAAVPATVAVGWAVGHAIWEVEFHRNRAVADEVVAALERFKYARGAYPGRLEEAMPDAPASLAIGGREYPLIYDRKEGEFILSYHQGWYVYVYESGRRRWDRRA